MEALAFLTRLDGGPRGPHYTRSRSANLQVRFGPARCPYRAIDRRIPGASAQIAGETCLHLRHRRLRTERNSGQDHPRRADAALRAAMFHKRLLKRMFAADYRKEVPGASLDDGINMFSRMLEEASPTNIVYLCDHKRDR